MRKITYKDIRQNCDSPQQRNIGIIMYNQIKATHNYLYGDLVDRDRLPIWNRIQFVSAYAVFLFVLFIFVPLLSISKLVQMLYPWIIVGYLGYNNLLFTNKINSFQMVMLYIYIGLQLILVFLGIFVGKVHWLLWHLDTSDDANWWQINNDQLMREMNKFYDNVAWFPVVENIILSKFGKDIGNIIMKYCKSFNIDP